MQEDGRLAWSTSHGTRQSVNEDICLLTAIMVMGRSRYGSTTPAERAAEVGRNSYRNEFQSITGWYEDDRRRVRRVIRSRSRLTGAVAS